MHVHLRHFLGFRHELQSRRLLEPSEHFESLLWFYCGSIVVLLWFLWTHSSGVKYQSRLSYYKMKMITEQYHSFTFLRDYFLLLCET